MADGASGATRAQLWAQLWAGFAMWTPQVKALSLSLRALVSLRQLGPDCRFGLCVIAFAIVAVDDSPFLVDQIDCWPVLIAVGVPRCVFIVLRDRVTDIEVLDGCLDVVSVVLERIFRRVHAPHDQTLALVFLIPALHVGEGIDAVAAGIGPEVHQHDLASQLLHGQRVAVEPFIDTGEFGCDDGCTIKRTCHRSAAGSGNCGENCYRSEHGYETQSPESGEHVRVLAE